MGSPIITERARPHEGGGTATTAHVRRRTGAQDSAHSPAWRYLEIGAGIALVAALAQYTSWQNQVVLDRWSLEFAMLFGLALLVVGSIALRATALALRGRKTTLAGVLARLGALAWASGYLVAAMDDPVQAGRLLDGNIAGSQHALAAFMEVTSFFCVAASVAVLVPKVSARWQNLAVLVLAILAMLGLLEGAARIWAFAAPQTQGFPTYRSARWSERFVSLNSLGFRDREHSKSRSHGKRALVVGDSYAFGWGIQRIEDRMGEQLAQLLSSMEGETWEPLNASRGDTHTRQHLQFLDTGLQFEPDLVILLYVFNDIDYLRPVTARGAITDPKSLWGRLHPTRVLFQNSYFFQEIHVRLRHLARATPSSQNREDPYTDEQLMAQHLEDIAAFVAKAQAVAPRVVIVPFDIAVVASPAAKERYDSFVRRLCNAGLPVVSMGSILHGLTQSDLAVNRLDRHPNERANLLLAQRLAPIVFRDVACQTGFMSTSGP